MAIVNPALPTIGGQRGDGESTLRSDIVSILAELNGNLDTTNVRDGSLRATDMDSSAVVTALPGAPYDGQEINYLADDTNGVVWRLKYRAGSASAYKWEYIGGAALFNEVAVGETTTSGTYVNLTTVGPTIALPLAGDYDVTVLALIANNTAGVSAGMSYAIGGTAASDNDWVSHQEPATGGGQNFENLARTRRKTGLTAVSLVAKYRVGGGGIGSFIGRALHAVPVRVG